LEIGAGVASGCSLADHGLRLPSLMMIPGAAGYVTCSSKYAWGQTLWPSVWPSWNDAMGRARLMAAMTANSSAVALNFLRASR